MSIGTVGAKSPHLTIYGSFKGRKLYVSMEGVVTTYRCKCGDRLVLRNLVRKGVNVLLFGCDRCQCHVVITDSHLRTHLYGNFFNWKKFLKNAYRTYVEARSGICL